MRSSSLGFKINIVLLFSGLFAIISGLLLQVEYHFGNHFSIPANKIVFGVSYFGWSTIHKISIVALSLLVIYHIYQHWKWYKVVIKKRLFVKNQQVLIYSFLFVLAAITGLTPWFIHIFNGNEFLRKAFVEIHDKLAIILSIYLVLHIIKRLKWFYTTFAKIIKA